MVEAWNRPAISSHVKVHVFRGTYTLDTRARSNISFSIGISKSFPFPRKSTLSIISAFTVSWTRSLPHSQDLRLYTQCASTRFRDSTFEHWIISIDKILAFLSGICHTWNPIDFMNRAGDLFRSVFFLWISLHHTCKPKIHSITNTQTVLQAHDAQKKNTIIPQNSFSHWSGANKWMNCYWPEC